MTLIRIDAGTSDWDEVVRSMKGHSIYQSAAYHRLAAQVDGGQATLLYFRKGDRSAAMPLILREIKTNSPGLVLRDATSVYGYPGILSNTDDYPKDFVNRFHEVLQLEMARENVVSVFTRLGVFRPGMEMIAGLGQVDKVGETVAIDLTIENETRFRNYRRNHRDNIKRLRSQGAVTIHDTDFEQLDAFEQAYEFSMRRVRALDWFSFGLPYFQELCLSLPEDVVLLRTDVDGEMACAGLFFCTGDVVYAHLTATVPDWVGRSPTKVLFDDAAKFFRDRGCKWLHLGGGIGAQDDSLYRYKRGFSKINVPFYVWKYIVDPVRYQELCDARGGNILEKEHCNSFFPQYRAHHIDADL